ncbi:MAG: RNA-binding S4 domain-containing protein [Candidatus Cloacimonas sp.]|nr:RNA-binding S4 domain-containing protein [Candidatus Cloacimonadota bacterium]
MLFRLNYGTDCIELEAFLKAVGLDEDYQQIRFKIKDGLIRVNGRVETGRRRLLYIDDTVSFDDKFYRIAEDRDRPDTRPKPRRRMVPDQEGDREGVEFIRHSQKPLKWSEKKIKDVKKR